MPLLTFYHYASLSESERFRLIGELLARAVIRYRRRQRMALVDTKQSTANDLGSVPAEAEAADETEQKILRHIARVGAATPHDLASALDLSRATVTRRLARMRKAGVLDVSGKTTAVRYQLRVQPA